MIVVLMLKRGFVAFRRAVFSFFGCFFGFGQRSSKTHPSALRDDVCRRHQHEESAPVSLYNDFAGSLPLYSYFWISRRIKCYQ